MVGARFPLAAAAVGTAKVRRHRPGKLLLVRSHGAHGVTLGVARSTNVGAGDVLAVVVDRLGSVEGVLTRAHGAREQATERRVLDVPSLVGPRVAALGARLKASAALDRVRHQASSCKVSHANVHIVGPASPRVGPAHPFKVRDEAARVALHGLRAKNLVRHKVRVARLLKRGANVLKGLDRGHKASTHRVSHVAVRNAILGRRTEDGAPRCRTLEAVPGVLARGAVDGTRTRHRRARSVLALLPLRDRTAGAVGAQAIPAAKRVVLVHRLAAVGRVLVTPKDVWVKRVCEQREGVTTILVDGQQLAERRLPVLHRNPHGRPKHGCAHAGEWYLCALRGDRVAKGTLTTGQGSVRVGRATSLLVEDPFGLGDGGSATLGVAQARRVQGLAPALLPHGKDDVVRLLLGELHAKAKLFLARDAAVLNDGKAKWVRGSVG
mmetsp:Transcript_8470/g.26995  ORF Transcript_8470/g.26995 Transcript_8470/m.26995 type:complete len:437 (+) Transcript_8470:505-1815(+)